MTEGYSSGGRYNGYNDPAKQVETGVRRDFMNQLGGSVANSSNQDIINALNSILDRSARESQVTVEALERAKEAIASAVNNAPNVQQGAKAGSEQATRIINNSSEFLKGFQTMRGTDNGRGNLGQVNNSPFLQLVNINQRMLDSLNRIEKTIGTGLKDIIRNENEIDDGNDKSRQQGEQQEADEFDQLKSTIVRTIMNSPTATKLGQLGASLISAGLFKVASNDKLPSWLRKGAMAAVYLQVPQTLMMIIGNIINLRLSNWLANGAGKILSNSLGGMMGNVGRMFGSFMGNIGGLFARLLPMAVPLIGAFLIGAGIFAGIKGIIDHRKKMKENDAKIDNDPTLTQGQKDMKKLGAHTKSGAKVGAVAGGLTGAGAGALYGAAVGSVIPGVGTAIGAAVGGIIGAVGGAGGGGIIGGIVGAMKPLGQGIKHLGQNMWRGLQNVGGKIVQGARWAVENREKIFKIIQPMAKFLVDLMVLINPFFRLFKVLSEKIMKLPFFGGSDNGGNGDSGMSLGDKVKSGLRTAGNYVATKFGVGGDKVAMKDLGLKGTIDGGNSVPQTLKKNAIKVQQLDHLLNKWGYDVTYTSNMGGQHKGGEKSHASGNKVDLQLTRGGKTAYLTKEQLAELQRLGYWGGSTGALGWEPVKGQVGGGHYDLHIGDMAKFEASDEHLAGLKKKYDDEAKAEAEKKAKAEEEKRKAEEQKKKDEEFAQKHPTLAKIGNAISSVGQQDISGTDKYTEAQKNSTTGAVITQGVKH